MQPIFNSSGDKGEISQTSHPGSNSDDRSWKLNMKSAPERETPRFLDDQHGEAAYVEPSHWLSILQDIKDIRSELPSNGLFPPTEAASEQDPLGLESDLALGLSLDHTLTIDDVISFLPSQTTCDMLLSQYFNSRFMVLGIVHYGTFRTEYQNFWTSPGNTSLAWLSLMLAILSMSIILRNKPNSQRDSSQQIPSIGSLQKMTAQCLISANYASARENAVEALLLYLQSRFMTQNCTNSQLWLEFGTLIRLAFRMGYHRDPSGASRISELDGEMRRRTWLHIFQIDALGSFQMGLPSMIPTEFCDTQPPRNLYDSDITVGLESLPPSRPSTDVTPILYAIVKSDCEMKETYQKIPETFRRRNISESFMDSSDIILERCTIELLYLKGIVVLHRRFLRHEPHNLAFELSRTFCLEAALDILARQVDIHQATVPGGRLHEDRWMVTSLTIHDFLLAAMIVCLDLSIRIESPERGNEEISISRKLQALVLSHQLWAGDDSPQSRLAALTLDLMIQRVKEVQLGGNRNSQTTNKESHCVPEFELPYIEAMSDIIDDPESLDWSLLDQLLQNPGKAPFE
ncbi:hypothetical protein N7462_001223 [Penicillium macrosclerotiorum]|uniref:uncharacterized protein n=1 Tax=Penicillium macrosclerotiorum TaxID=303699 RepID=UPI00254978C4|nr:uncharacterized protein N7462_001223 [Penicillium macrosclerotiorum]KAJ5691800.1 hypothetical protein N7462_001223 [Penicillium macrosclerotiorum]